MLPLADASVSWDAGAARKRLNQWAGGHNEKYAQAFLYADPSKDVFKLPIADLIDGQLKAVPHAIYSAAAVLNGAMDSLQLSDSDKASCKSKLTAYYDKLGKPAPFKEATADEVRLTQAEYDLAVEKVLILSAQLGRTLPFMEGAIDGSLGGHDPDFEKLKNGLPDWWRKLAATDPHPFAYCVTHLGKKFPDPNRICAWLKDQALGTTSWRKTENHKESALDSYEPTLSELKLVMECMEEAIQDAGSTSQETTAQESENGSGGDVEEIVYAGGKRTVVYANGTTGVE